MEKVGLGMELGNSGFAFIGCALGGIVCAHGSTQTHALAVCMQVSIEWGHRGVASIDCAKSGGV